MEAAGGVEMAGRRSSLSRRLALGLALAAQIAASCTAGTPDSGSTAGRTPEARFTGGSLLIWTDPSHTTAFGRLADAFTERNPGVVLRVEERSLEEIGRAIQAVGADGEGPDLFVGVHEWLADLIPGGAVAPIDLGDRGDGFLPVALESFTRDGRLYGVPFGLEGVALVRNTELVPTPPATWEELAEVAVGLARDGNVEVGLAIPAPDPYYQYPLFSAYGGYVFRDEQGRPDPGDVGIDSPGGLQAAEAFAAWARSGLISNNLTYDEMLEAFGNGDAAFAITGPWSVLDPIRGFKAMGVPYAVEPLPPVGGADPRPLVAVQGLMVSAYSENPLIAASFATDVVATKEAQLELSAEGGRPPALEAALAEPSFDPDLKGFAESARNGVLIPAIPETSLVWSPWRDAYRMILGGRADAGEAFRAAAEQIRRLIARR